MVPPQALEAEVDNMRKFKRRMGRAVDLLCLLLEPGMQP